MKNALEKRRWLALLLAAVMLLPMLPAVELHVHAEAGTETSESGTGDSGTSVTGSDAGTTGTTDTGSTGVPCTDDTCSGTYSNGFCTKCGAYQKPDTDASGTYLIANAGNLYWFAEKVNSGSTTINAKLTADIVVYDLTFKEDGGYNGSFNGEYPLWEEPIGKDNAAYRGTFDGQYHTISGLYYNDEYTLYHSSVIGLFGYIGGGATVKNVGLINSYFTTEGEFGGIAYQADADTDDITISGCYSSAFFGDSDNYEANSPYVGGIVAGAYASGHKLTITDCYNAIGRTVNGNEENSREWAYVGGIVAYAETDKGGSIEITKCCNTVDLAATVSYEDVYVGGIAAYVEADGGSIKITECYNTGSLTATDTRGWAYAGGVVAYAKADNSSSLVITGCYNTGSLAATTGGDLKLELLAYTGGIAAYAEALSSSSIDITVCYNTGKLTATSTADRGNEEKLTCAGGIFGYATAYDALAFTISNCYNIGDITSSDRYNYCAGGIAGHAEGSGVWLDLTISNCFAASTQYGEYDCAGVVVAFPSAVTVKNCYYTSNSPFGDYKVDVHKDNVCRADYADFVCGDVKWGLNNENVNGVWKQTLGVDKYPNFTGADIARKDGVGIYNPTHIWENGVCTDCGKICTHNFGTDGICTVCGVYCSCEPDESGVCTICGQPLVARVTIGDTISYRANLNAAFAAASGQTATITLLRDTTFSSTIEIGGSKTNITLIGGVCTVSAACTMFKITAGTLTVQSGKYTASSGKVLDTENPFEQTYITTSSNVFEVTGGTLNVKSGTYSTALGNVIEVSGSATDSTASSGSSSGEGTYVPSIDTGKISTTTVGTVNISGGSFTSESGHAVYVTSVSTEDSSSVIGSVAQGTANITGGSFTGSSYAVYIDKGSGAGTVFGGCGKLNVSGGSFGKLYVNGVPDDEVVLTGGTFAGVEVGLGITPGAAPCAAVLADGYAFFDSNGKGVKLTDVSGDKAGTVKLCTVHGWDSETGICLYCTAVCAHESWSSATGACATCGFPHDHTAWTSGVCDGCGYPCPHGSWEDAICTTCGVTCTDHVWDSKTGSCSVCGTPCTHGEVNDENTGCAICGYAYPVSVTVKNALMVGDEGTTTYYFTLEEAVAAAVTASAKNNSSSIYIVKQIVTVTLLSDVTLTDTVEIASSAADIILVGGEHTVSATDTMFKITAGTLTVQSGNFITKSGHVFYVSGTVTLPTSSGGEEGTYVGGITSVGSTTETTTSGTVNISGGSYTSAGHTVYVTRVTESDTSSEPFTVYTAMGTANISGGVFTSTDGYAVYNVSEDAGDKLAGGNLRISGGEFNGGLYVGGVSVAVLDDNTVMLSGGTFSRVNCATSGAPGSYLPQYYAFFIADDSGAYTVPTAAGSINAKEIAVEIKLCSHIYTNADGICDICGKSCTHTWNSETGICATCGFAHVHDETWTNGVCSVCGYQCKHGSWEGTTCKICGFICTDHDWGSVTGKCRICGFAHTHESYDENGACTVCGYQCKHGSWDGTTCTICGFVCTNHVWNGKTGSCSVCGYLHIHENYGTDGCCTECGGYQRPSTDASGTYLIANTGHLYWFAAWVNAGNTASNGKLTADIVVNKDLLKSLTFDDNGKVTNGENFRMWTPICGYTGTFDGNGHTISGLYYNGRDSYIGLFGSLDGGASIKNVGVIDNYFCVFDNSIWVYLGGLVGSVSSSNEKTVTLENCYHSGTIIAKNIYKAYVGGLVGDVYCGRDGAEITIRNCYNTGSVINKDATKEAYIGGLIGYVEYGLRGVLDKTVTVENCHNSGTVSDRGSSDRIAVGGLLGYAYHETYWTSSLTFQNCYNMGAVSSDSDGACVGGLIGQAGSEEVAIIEIQTCFNAGTVSATADGGTKLGGLIGSVDIKSYTGKMSVENSYNTGAVSGISQKDSIGGMFGYISIDDGTLSLENGYNTGSVSGAVQADIGTLVGCLSIIDDGKMTIRNVYWLNSVGEYEFGEEEDWDEDEMTYENVASKSADEFASGAVAWLLNGSTDSGVWRQVLGTDASPNFTGARVSFANETYYISSAAKVSIGETVSYYDTLEAAFAAASGQTASITLLGNTTLTSSIEISDANSNITLIGGEYTVSAACTMFRITAGTLTVQNGTYTATSGQELDVSAVPPTYIATSSHVFVVTGGTLNVKGGTYSTALGNVIEVSGSTTDSGTSSGDLIYKPDIGTTTVGTANIEGGSFTSESGYALYVTSVSTGDSSYVVGSVKQGTANITGGTFVGSSYAVYVDKASSIVGNCGKLNVSGGTFGKLYVVSEVLITEVELSGGTFEGIELAQTAIQVTPDHSIVLKSGYAFFTADESGEYTVLTASTDITDKAVAVKLCTHVDADNDLTCDICGEQLKLTFAGYTLILRSRIGVNFYTVLSEEFESSENAYIAFTVNGRTITLKVSEAEVREGYHIFTVPVSAHEMAYQITAKAYLDGDPVASDSESVRDYAMYIINNSTAYEDADVAFAKALLNYGAASQTYFGVMTDDLANKALAADDQQITQPTLDELGAYKLTGTYSGELGTFTGTSLYLASATSLRAYFEPAAGVDITAITFTVTVGGAVKKTITLDSSAEHTENGYMLAYDDLMAYELGDKVTFTATCGEQNVSFTCSAMTYAYNVISRPTDTTLYTEELKTLMSALYNYMIASGAYGGTNNAE